MLFQMYACVSPLIYVHFSINRLLVSLFPTQANTADYLCFNLVTEEPCLGASAYLEVQSYLSLA